MIKLQYRMQDTKVRIKNLEDKTMKITKHEQRENRLEKHIKTTKQNRISETCWSPTQVGLRRKTWKSIRGYIIIKMKTEDKENILKAV